MLNQQLIQDMFQDETSKEHIEQGQQQCSLNYTVSSRASKHKKSSQEDFRQVYQNDPFDILSLASNELSKFNSWLSDSQIKFEQNLTSISSVLSEIESSPYQGVNQDDLSIIKNQLFKKQNQQIKNSPCKECPCLKDKIKQLQAIVEKDKIIMADYERSLGEKQLRHQVQETMDDLLSKVEITLLNDEIKQLQNDVSVLKNEKYNLEVSNFLKQKTSSLFNKTKNSDLQFRLQLQKSKGLSAAKNSTNSSEITRHQETIVFIDPVESDVEEWIKFFQIQKNRYMNMCKKEEHQRIKALGRNFTKEEKKQLHLEGRVFVIFASIKDIWKNLIRIRENTKSFLAIESKNFIKQRFNSQNQPESTQPLKEQNEKLNTKIAKLGKMNDYLKRQKQNLNEINEGLRKEMVRQNRTFTGKEKEMGECLSQLQRLRLKVLEYEIEGGLLRK